MMSKEALEQLHQMQQPNLLEQLNQLELLNGLKQLNPLEQPTLLEQLNRLGLLNRLKQLNSLEQLNLLKQLNPLQQQYLLKQLDPLQVNLVHEQSQLQMSQLQQELYSSIFTANRYLSLFKPVNLNPPIFHIRQPISNPVPSFPSVVANLSNSTVEKSNLPNLENNDLSNPTKMTRRQTRSLNKGVKDSNLGNDRTENNDVPCSKKITKKKRIQKIYNKFSRVTDMAILVGFVEKYKHNWTLIANRMVTEGFRGKKPDVWHNIYCEYKQPLRAKRENCTQEEIEWLKELIVVYGRNWKEIAEIMDITVARARNLYYRYLQEKKKADPMPTDLDEGHKETRENKKADIKPKDLEVEPRKTRRNMLFKTIPQQSVLSVENNETDKTISRVLFNSDV